MGASQPAFHGLEQSHGIAGSKEMGVKNSRGCGAVTCTVTEQGHVVIMRLYYYYESVPNERSRRLVDPAVAGGVEEKCIDGWGRTRAGGGGGTFARKDDCH